MVAAGGSLSVVLQLPSSAQEEGIGLKSLSSMQTLRQNFRLIEPAQLREQVEGSGFHLQQEVRQPLASGKSFWMGIFGRHL